MNAQSLGRLFLIATIVLVIAGCGKKAGPPQDPQETKELPALEQNFVYLTNRPVPPAPEDVSFTESPNLETETVSEEDAEMISPILD